MEKNVILIFLTQELSLFSLLKALNLVGVRENIKYSLKELFEEKKKEISTYIEKNGPSLTNAKFLMVFTALCRHLWIMDVSKP